MTSEEFKQTYPDKAHLEGIELINAMEDAFLHQQPGEEIIKTTYPFYKRYQLRWLFYVKKPNIIFGTERNSSEMCKNCKKGSSTQLWMGRESLCIYCGNLLIEVPNTNLRFLLNNNLYTPIINFLWKILEYSHLIKYTQSGRYDMFGDEARYVKYWSMNYETGKTSYVLHERKWYEYIFIKK